MPNRTDSGAQHGFSVIEVMIALVILGVGLTAMAQLQKGNVDGAGYARQSAKASALMQAKAAELAPFLSTASSGSTTIDDAGTKYTINWKVNKAINGTTLVNVTANWPDAPAPMSLGTVEKLYTPDIVPPVAASPPMDVIFASASSSSCQTYDDDDDPKGSCSGTVTGASMTVKKEDD